MRVGASWADGTRIYGDSGTAFFWETLLADEYSFWLRAKDTTQNYSSTSAVATLQIEAPGMISNFDGLVIYNMIKLTWIAPTTGSFAVAWYNIYKGSTFATAEFLGSANATLKIIQEQTGGNYIYWVTAVDAYGNEGQPKSLNLRVDSPPFFELLYDQQLNPANALTLTNALVEDGAVLMPVITGRTYTQHFTDNSWSTPQDQINAGYPLFIQPATASTAIYEQSFDYGETITGALITLVTFGTWVDGSGTVVTTISYSANNSSWTNTTDVSQVYGVNFRYVKIKYEVSGTDTTSIYKIYCRLRLEVKNENDSGVITAVSTDASGTLVTYNKNFLDILEKDVNVSFKGSSAYFPSYTLAANELRVFLWNTSGNRVSGSVKWEVTGIVAL